VQSTKDLYKLLGLSREASQDDIRKAHRKLAREYHPDANPEDPRAEERFKEVQQAYEVLSNPHKRREYDQGLRATASSRRTTSRAARPTTARRRAARSSGGNTSSTIDLSGLLGKLRDVIGDVQTYGFPNTGGDVSDGKPSGPSMRGREKKVKGPSMRGREKRVKGPRAKRKEGEGP
jgi:DnaJ-class molecular chaperone